MGRKENGRVPTNLGRAFVRSRHRKAQELKHNTKFAGRHVADFAGDESGRLESVVERNDLDEFLVNAVLADQQFVAEKQQIFILDDDAKATTVLDMDDLENAVDNKDEAHPTTVLRIPRRPHWDENTTPEELDRLEKDAFLEWRRGFAKIEESTNRPMTPFEKNLEVWKQLWRVIERSDVVVQIVDARDPLLYRCQDVEDYVKEVNPNKLCILLVNKSDFLTPLMRTMWAQYFQRSNIDFVFFSALSEQERIDSLDEDLTIENPKGEEADGAAAPVDAHQSALPSRSATARPATHVYSREELLVELAARYMQRGRKPYRQDGRITIGTVGYPNVGKSSTINVLVGQKKVSVAATPGKTKHFQTLLIGKHICVCDCPGLVFPTFLHTAAELVVSGVLPIDQMKDHNGPIAVVCRRIPRAQLYNRYAVILPGDRPVDGSTFLARYAEARGFMKDHGRPDESRTARLVLKDYANGHLLFCHHPPDLSVEERRNWFANYLSLPLNNVNVEDVSQYQLGRTIEMRAIEPDSTSQSKGRPAVRGPAHVTETDQGVRGGDDVDGDGIGDEKSDGSSGDDAFDEADNDDADGTDQAAAKLSVHASMVPVDIVHTAESAELAMLKALTTNVDVKPDMEAFKRLTKSQQRKVLKRLQRQRTGRKGRPDVAMEHVEARVKGKHAPATARRPPRS